MLRFVVGHSDAENINDATVKVIAQCIESIEEYEQTVEGCPPARLALFFSTVRVPSRFDYSF